MRRWPTSSSPIAKAGRKTKAIENQPAGRTVDAGSLTLDFALPGRERLNNLLDLVGAKTQIVDTSTGGNQNGQQPQQPPTCESPFREDSGAMRDYIPKLFDNFSVNSATSIPGRLNINQAPRPLLLGIPGMDTTLVDQIIATRMPVQDGQRPEQAYETWPLVSGLVDLATMKQLMPLITAGGNVYRAQVVGYFDEGGPAYRLEAVVDATQTPPVVKRRRDLVEQGPGYSLDVLGATVEDGP